MDDLTLRRIAAARRAWYITRGPCLADAGPTELAAWQAVLAAPDVDAAIRALITGMDNPSRWEELSANPIIEVHRRRMRAALAAARAVE